MMIYRLPQRNSLSEETPPQVGDNMSYETDNCGEQTNTTIEKLI